VAPALRALARQSLLHEHQPGRWRMHDLVRLYAGERATGEQSTPRRRAAQLRLVDFYLHTAYAADRLYNPHRSAIALDEPTPGADPVAAPDEAAAQSWLEAEHACLLAAQRLAGEQGWDHRVWQLAWVMDTLHHRRGYLHEELDTWQIGLAAAQRAGDPLVQALALRNLGRVEVAIGRFADGTGHLDRALPLTEEAGEVADQASIHCLLAATWERRGSDERALHHAARAEELYRALEEPAGRAAALNLVGWYSARLGLHERAHTCLEAGLALARRLRDRDIEAATLDSLGYLARHTGRLGPALEHYRQALAIRRDLGDTYHEANTLEHLGDTHADLRQPEQAVHHWRQALLLYQVQRRTAEAHRIGQRLHA
jgi:tetratricopeptide (TPR) repeat protein